MSDDTNLPPLRLKPRHRADSPPQSGAGQESVPAPATPPAAPAPAAAPAAPPEAAVPVLFAPSEPPAPAVPPAVVLPPAATPPAAPAKTQAGDTLDLGRLKLKPRVASAEPSPVLPAASAPTHTAAPLPAVPLPVAPAPTPVAPPPAVSAPVLPPVMPPPSTAGGLPPLAPSAAKPAPFIRAKTDGGKSSAAKVAPEDSPAFRAGVWAFVGLIVVALAGIGYFGYRFVSAKNEKKHAVAAQAAKPAPAPKTAAAAPEAKPASSPAAKPSLLATNDPQSTAGKLIAKAEATIAQREQSGQVQGVDQVLDSTPPQKPAAAVKAVPAAPAPTTAPAAAAGEKPAAKPASEPTEAAAKAAAPAKVEPAAPPPEPIVLVAPKPKPSAAFRVYVVNARVSGVFQGDPGRVLLNGRMFRIGELVEPQLGIRLTRLDVEHKMLYFEDVSGAEMERHY